MMSRNMVKSNASSVQPNHAAHQASHWSFVGSFHHGVVPAVVTAVVMAHPWSQAGSITYAKTVFVAWTHRLFGLDSFFGRFTVDNASTPSALNAEPLSTDQV